MKILTALPHVPSQIFCQLAETSEHEQSCGSLQEGLTYFHWAFFFHKDLIRAAFEDIHYCKLNKEIIQHEQFCNLTYYLNASFMPWDRMNYLWGKPLEIEREMNN